MPTPRLRPFRRRREWVVLALLVPAASCVPQASRPLSAASAAPAVPVAAPAAGPAASAAPTSGAPVAALPAAAPFDFGTDDEGDRARALNCLAEAVYYEARSEDEDGQRAVAQVVLNRVRHPAYPASVCGVVFQGPMKPGGGCQFTFTCDGSLARRPVEPGWSRARRIAAEALAGKVFAPVGYATHYHAFTVAPAWAPELAKVTVIGSHIFYRWRGSAGAPAAFSQDHAEREPMPRIPRVTPDTAISAPAAPQLAYAPTLALPEPPVDRLPQSGVRPEYARSGAWLSDRR